jgi:hypothetical protein
MHGKQRRATAALALLAAGTAALLFYCLPRRHLPHSDPVAPLPAVRPGAFLNAAPEATYVGLKSCVACHPQEHESYLATGHSRSLRDVDPASEPPGSEFRHATSGRIYEIYRRDREFRHRESVQTPGGEALVLADLPMRYAIGSGRFSRSYLASRNGFLVESPATWYAARPGWDISPGYDRHNNGFERPIVSECINCHVGRAETAGGSIQRFEFHAQAIDCERCHGPGSLHVARWQGERSEQVRNGSGGPDSTIGNPLRLSRADSEAICAQCHLHSAATVELRGRRLSEFRPGQKLGDFCVHYGLQSPSHEMRVVGHVEQLRLSRCYLASDALTCTTCHDPHGAPPAERTADYFRGKCLSCHTEQGCGLPVAVRTMESRGDNCITCHMPTAPTDIPHFAFTHHRIGIHRPEPSRDEAPVAGTLIPLDDVSHLAQIEQDRCLGLAYLQCSSNSPDNEATYRGRAQELLEEVRVRGMLDPEVDAALARLHWRIDADRTMEFAAAVLRHNHATPESRVTALFTLATTLMDQGRAEEAVAHLEELIQLRLYSEDWFLLSVCRLQGGDARAALDAAQRAAEISPQFPQLQEHLADLYLQLGRGPEAAQSRLRAAQLRHSNMR